MDKRVQVLSENIRRRRSELQMSQDELAKLVGYRNRSTISKIESGQVDIGVTKLMDIAKVLRVSVDRLLGLEDKA